MLFVNYLRQIQAQFVTVLFCFVSVATGVARRSASPNQRQYPLQLRWRKMPFWFHPQNSPGTNRSLHCQVGLSPPDFQLSFCLYFCSPFDSSPLVQWRVATFYMMWQFYLVVLFYFFESNVNACFFSMWCLLNWHMKQFIEHIDQATNATIFLHV